VGHRWGVGGVGPLVDEADFQEVVPEVRLEVREVAFPGVAEERVDLEAVVVVEEVDLEVVGVVAQGVVLEVGVVVGEDFEVHNPCTQLYARRPSRPKQHSIVRSSSEMIHPLLVRGLSFMVSGS